MREKITAYNTRAVMIDMQEKLMPAMAHRNAVTARAAFFLQALRVLEIPVTVTQQYTRGLGMTLPELNQERQSENYIDKITYSCLGCEEFRSAIRAEEDRKTILLFGVEAHICVLQTALDLIHEGYRVYLVCDCTDSRSTLDRDTAVSRMIQAGVIPTTSESVLYEMLERAGTPEFRRISALVKTAPLYETV